MVTPLLTTCGYAFSQSYYGRSREKPRKALHHQIGLGGVRGKSTHSRRQQGIASNQQATSSTSAVLQHRFRSTKRESDLMQQDPIRPWFGIQESTTTELLFRVPLRR